MDARERAGLWVHSPIDRESQVTIQHLIDNDTQALQDAFYSTLSFGTGGMRGLMGLGSAKINIYTIQMATQGLANYLLKNVGYEASVFISYDSRNQSKEFANQAARVLAGNGIRAHLTRDLRPTPFVSFGLRKLRCSAGIMITASHNPKEYNGYKVYWRDGAQVVSPHDGGIVQEVNRIISPGDVKLSPEHSKLIEWVNPELDLEYLEALDRCRLQTNRDKEWGSQLHITYTPLYGTGQTLLPQALKRWGFTHVDPVDSQLLPNGDFPTVQSPNPESHEALSLGIEQMRATNSDLLIATDPDADRVGIVARRKGEPFILSGNQIALLCLAYIGKMRGAVDRGAVVSTIVSSDLIGKLAKSFGYAYFEVLTGFKYIGELIETWDQDQSHQFVFGAEESYGYLVGTHSRDKDAIAISCLLSEAALFFKTEGRTLVDSLEEIYKEHGLYHEGQKSLNFSPGQEGMNQMTAMMKTLRSSPPKSWNGASIDTIEDYSTGRLPLPKSNVLLYRLSDGSKVVVRPSGTEPKLKIYVGVTIDNWDHLEDGLATAREKIQALINDVEDHLS